MACVKTGGIALFRDFDAWAECDLYSVGNCCVIIACPWQYGKVNPARVTCRVKSNPEWMHKRTADPALLVGEGGVLGFEEGKNYNIIIVPKDQVEITRKLFHPRDLMEWEGKLIF